MIQSPETDTKAGGSIKRGRLEDFFVGNYSLYGYLSSPLCPAYPTTNIKWFSRYMHRTAGLLKEKVLMYVILTRKRTILSISSLFHSEQVITDPAPQDRDTSKNQALKANYPSLRFWNTQVTSAGICIFKLQIFSKE